MLPPVTTSTIDPSDNVDRRAGPRATQRQLLPRVCRLASSAATAPAISSSDTSSISSASASSHSTASGIATRTARPSAIESHRSQSTGRPARQESAITGAPAETTPIAGSRRARPSQGPTPASSAPLPTGTRIASERASRDQLVGDRPGRRAPARRRPQERRAGSAAWASAASLASSRSAPASTTSRLAAGCAIFVGLATLARTPSPSGQYLQPPRQLPRRGCRWTR